MGLKPIHNAISNFANQPFVAPPIKTALLEGLVRHDEAMNAATQTFEPKNLGKLAATTGAAALIMTSQLTRVPSAQAAPISGTGASIVDVRAAPPAAELAGATLSTAPRLWGEAPSTDEAGFRPYSRMSEAKVAEVRALHAAQPRTIDEALVKVMTSLDVAAHVLGPVVDQNQPGFALTIVDLGDGAGPRVYKSANLEYEGQLSLEALDGKTLRVEQDPDLKFVNGGMRTKGHLKDVAVFMRQKDPSMTDSFAEVRENFSRAMLKRLPTAKMDSQGYGVASQTIRRLQSSTTPDAAHIRAGAKLDEYNTAIDVSGVLVDGVGYVGTLDSRVFTAGTQAQIQRLAEHAGRGIAGRPSDELSNAYVVLSGLGPDGGPAVAVVPYAQIAKEAPNWAGTVFSKGATQYTHFSDRFTQTAADAKAETTRADALIQDEPFR